VKEIPLTEKQWQFAESIEKHSVTLYGGAKGGGKSHGLRLIMLMRRLEYPGSIGYIFRRTFPELESNHISPLFEQFPELRQYYNEGKKTLRLPNGSQLRFAYCGPKKDLMKFQGREMHDLAIEEAGDWPHDYYDFLRTCNRSSRPHIKARTLLTGNPGGIGHKWLKRLFVERKYEGNEKPSDYNFIPALVSDNPALEKSDPDYKLRLSSLKNELLRRAFLYGDWDIQAGQFFNEFSRDIHVVKPFKIPRHWNWFGSYDYGFNHPSAWHFWVCDEDGNVYLVNEIVRAKMRIDEQITSVKEYLKKMTESGERNEGGIIFWAGHDCWAQKKGGDPTISEDFSKQGVLLRRANIDRKQGASQVRMYLAHKKFDDGKKEGPRVFIFSHCEITIDCLTRMTHNPDNVEDVLKVDAVDGDPMTGDDPYDCFRYGIMSRPTISNIPKRDRGNSYDREEVIRPSWRTV